MEWLSNLLGFANQGSSPFGALSGSTAMTPPSGQPSWLPHISPPNASGVPYSGMGTNPAPSTAPTSPGGMQFPGLLGRIMGQPNASMTGGTGGTGLAGGNNNALFSQALKLIQGPQMQAPPTMNLLSGPRA